MSQQAVSADIIPNSAVGNIFPKNKRNKDTRTLGILISWKPHKLTNLEA
jgi:hypothetical protein